MPASPRPSLESPDLTAILVAPDGLDAIRKTLRAVHDQDLRDRIQIVLVSDDPTALEGATDLFPDFWGIEVVVFEPIERMGPAKAAGIQHARADLIVQLEDHAYPRPGWARALLEAWREGTWSAVAPVMANANPASGTSWANLFVGYGRWVAPSRSGERAALPGHNSAFGREVLVELGDRLGNDLDEDWRLFHRLSAEGHRFYLTADAVVEHQNISNRRAAMVLRYQHGRLTAAQRSRSWSTTKRLAHVLATPLIPMIRFRESWGHVRDSGVDASVRLKVLPSLLFLVLVGGVAEGVGYALGEGDAPRRKADLEHDRSRHLSAADRAEVDRELRELAAETV